MVQFCSAPLVHFPAALDRLTRLEDLPKGARAYVDRLEELIGVPVDIISTGPHRGETIMVRDVLRG